MTPAPTELVLEGDLRDSILEGQCIAFVGSGASAGVYDPWDQLINKLCIACGCPDRVSSDDPPERYLEAAENARRSNTQQYHAYLNGAFGQPVSTTHVLYGALMALPFRGYLTTNFDRLLATEGTRARPPLKPKAWPNLDRLDLSHRATHYLHGIIEEGSNGATNIVLSKSEFANAYADNGNLMNFLLQTLDNDPICFIGCQLREPAMQRVFEICRRHQADRLALRRPDQTGGAPPKRYIFLPEPLIVGPVDKHPELAHTAKKEAENYYNRIDINVVWYKRSGDDHSALTRAFERLAQIPPVRIDYQWRDGGPNAN